MRHSAIEGCLFDNLKHLSDGQFGDKTMAHIRNVCLVLLNTIAVSWFIK